MCVKVSKKENEFMSVCVCVCIRERERGKEKDIQKENVRRILLTKSKEQRNLCEI